MEAQARHPVAAVAVAGLKADMSSESGQMQSAGLRLGIDTGGTYTDAVLVDDANRILASSKSLTTRHDLTLGIGDALNGLSQEAFADVSLVALSTTLSTNSVVEGKGAPVGVLLPGYKEQQVIKSGLLDIFDKDLVAILPGGHDEVGKERTALDEPLVREAIDRQKGRVAAFAVSSMFGVRNPAHEIRVRELVTELSSKPVTCGHELASDLDAPRRALTVALNARMIPIIHELIQAVSEILAEKEITAPLMMVKGNGSLINTETALKQPVGTVLSGPAASVVGACALSGAENAIIADMGGTTTDIAVITGGQPELGSDGVLIGDWRPMVEAVRVIAIGLGGDSEVRFNAREGIGIGPRRAVPLSLLGHLHPELADRLRRQLDVSPSRRNNRFAMRLEYNEVLMAECSGQELSAWDLLSGGPVELDEIVNRDREAARAIARLQRKGMVIYSGFTPTDAAHVLGLSSHWCPEAARLAALIWARQMRHVYGIGRWREGDAETPSRHVFEKVGQQISRALIEAGLHQHRSLDEAASRNLTGLLADLVFESSDSPGPHPASGSLFHLNFAADYPVVGVGAPASTFFPDAAERLGVELTLPASAEVANAFGAVMGSVVQRASVLVTQPLHGQFIVHGDRGPIHFSSLADAVSTAEELAREKVGRLARDAGADAAEIRLSSEDKHIHHDVDGDLFLETRITATATGRPRIC
jgi:N-methylhydantoinase A/oxoprolinase/acetone carboxylase beta subunit